MDVAHPLEVDLAPGARDELGRAPFDGLDGRFRERADFHEPLARDQRLDGLAAALAVTDRVLVLIDRQQQPGRLEVGDDLDPRHVAIEPGVGGTCLVRHPAVRADHEDLVEPVPLTGREVVGVVPRCDLDHPGAEFGVDHPVTDDRNLAVHERDDNASPDALHVALVVGVNGDRGIAE